MAVFLEVIFAFFTMIPSYDRKSKKLTYGIPMNRRFGLFLVLWTCFILLLSFLYVRF